MTDSSVDQIEIEHKWLIDASHADDVYRMIGSWRQYQIVQHYLINGVLKVYADVLRSRPGRAVIYIDGNPTDWTIPLPEWAYHIASGQNPGAVRLRSLMDQDQLVWRYFLTIKSKGSHKRGELEAELPEEIYNKLLELHMQGSPVSKRRFTREIPGGHKLELDIFDTDERLKGLILLEVEFASEEEAESFVLPDFVMRLNPKMVTEDKRYGNLSLAINGLPTD